MLDAIQDVEKQGNLLSAPKSFRSEACEVLAQSCGVPSQEHTRKSTVVQEATVLFLLFSGSRQDSKFD